MRRDGFTRASEPTSRIYASLLLHQTIRLSVQQGPANGSQVSCELRFKMDSCEKPKHDPFVGHGGSGRSRLLVRFICGERGRRGCLRVSGARIKKWRCFRGSEHRGHTHFKWHRGAINGGILGLIGVCSDILEMFPFHWCVYHAFGTGISCWEGLIDVLVDIQCSS